VAVTPLVFEACLYALGAVAFVVVNIAPVSEARHGSPLAVPWPAAVVYAVATLLWPVATIAALGYVVWAAAKGAKR
jgi:hypothetical protein